MFLIRQEVQAVTSQPLPALTHTTDRKAGNSGDCRSNVKPLQSDSGLKAYFEGVQGAKARGRHLADVPEARGLVLAVGQQVAAVVLGVQVRDALCVPNQHAGGPRAPQRPPVPHLCDSPIALDAGVQAWRPS